MLRLLQGGLSYLVVGTFVILAGSAMVHLAARDRPVADIAALPMMDQDRVPRSLGSWRGKVVVLDFIYTGCGDTCPLKSAQLAGVQAGLDPALRRRVEFVSVSVDPEHDDPAALKAYAARTGADLSGWSFLTGDLSQVAHFAAAFDAMPVSEGETPSHITTVRLLDPAGRVVQRYLGEPIDDRQMASDIIALASAVPP